MNSSGIPTADWRSDRLTCRIGDRHYDRGFVTDGADPDAPVCPPVSVTVEGNQVGVDPAVPGRLLELPPSLSDGAEDEAVRAALWRLGLARWAATFCPIPLAPDLLAADLLIAADEAWQLGADVGSEASAAAALAEQRLVALARRWRAGSVPTHAAEEVGKALKSGLRWLDIDGPDRATLNEALDGVHGTGQHDDPISAAISAGLEGLGRSTVAQLSGHGESDPQQKASRHTWTTDVDWAQVPVGVLDPNEETVEVTVTEAPGSVSVQVKAAGSIAHMGLRFRMLQPDPDPSRGWRLLADGSLIKNQEKALYSGRAGLPSHVELPLSTDVVVDVYDALSMDPPRVAAAREQATAQRYAAHALAYQRLAAVTDSEGDRAGMLSLAADCWLKSAVRLHGLPEAAAIATAAEVQCRMQRPGLHPNAAKYLQRRLDALPPRPRPSTEAETAARPLLAELAMPYPGLAA